MLVEEGRSLRGAIVVVKRFRGSTVGAYVLLAARRRGCNIVGIVCQKPDPVVIAGCVLAGIPIAYAIPEEFFDLVRDGVLLCIDPKRGVEICDAVC
jgi:predicted aconitase with swiveling domain